MTPYKYRQIDSVRIKNLEQECINLYREKLQLMELLRAYRKPLSALLPVAFHSADPAVAGTTLALLTPSLNGERRRRVALHYEHIYGVLLEGADAVESGLITGRSAAVTMATVTDAAASILTLNGTTFNGRVLIVRQDACTSALDSSRFYLVNIFSIVSQYHNMHPIKTHWTFTYWLYSDSDGGSIIDNSLGLNEKNYDPYASTNSSNQPNQQSIWSGFHKKALRERQNQLRLVYPTLFPSSASSQLRASGDSEVDLTKIMSTVSLAGLNVDVQDQEFPVTGLDEKVADNMIENCIGTMGLPVGLALNFVINGKPTVIPMVVEEPSVVAAVSGAAKTICCPGSTGFVASTSPRNITYAQVSILDVPDVLAAADHIRGRKQELIDLANSL
ncbi:hypothetical protein HDU99_003804, partial [Rhizoclosmatium hyalinum]